LQPYDADGNILTVAPIQPDEDGDYLPEEDDAAPAVVAARPAVSAAQTSITDFTRNIQKKKEKELEALQFVGGDSTSSASAPKTVVKGTKVGRNDPCPCGSGKKYKKCHGA
jgi:preprotein translocase subunit SecA